MTEPWIRLQWVRGVQEQLFAEDFQPELNEGWGPKPQPSPHFSGRRLVMALLEICRRSKVARLYG